MISGNGHVEKSGVGTLALTNAHTYTGGTTIQQGTLVIGAGGTTGSIVGNITITNTATLAFNRLGSTSFAGVVSGSGRLIKAGSNTLTLTGNNAHTGVTTIQGGTLQIGNGGTTGSIAGSVANAGAVVFNRSDSSSLAGAISGNGSLTKLGAGTLTLTGANTYRGGTTLTSGTLQVGNGGTTGSFAGNIANAGALIFNRSDSNTFAGIVSGSGSLTKLGAGTLILNGANTYSGGTTISGGTLEIGLYGRVNGNIVNNGVLAFNAQNTGTTAIVDGVVSGSGSLLKLGGGDGTHTVVLTGANTYTGGTTISAGVLSIGNGGTTGSIAGNVVNNATLIFNRSDDTSFAGLISGSGGVTKSGAGTLTITGNNTYTGTTQISGGALQLAGALNGTSGVSVAQGATLETDADAGIALGGTGARMDVEGVLASGGTGAGQLNLALGAGGKLGFAAGSILSFNLGATPDLIAFDQVGDWLDGSGKATLQLSAVDHGQAYTVFRNASTQNFMFANIAGYDATNYTANFFQSGDDYNLSFSAVPVPEADTYLLMLAGLGLVGFRVLRRRQSVI